VQNYSSKLKIYLGADHRGFKLREKIFQWLVDKGYEVEDYGAYELDPKDDYTVYAEKVGSIVGRDDRTRGILLCGSGVGADIASNKFDGVRASIGKSPEQVKAGRNDDDMNILVIAADFTKEEDAKEMVKVFLKTKFVGKARHKRRLDDIRRIEANN
jgi:ribose 5-phosphate isomerase B